jgi:hypothetical protein
MRKNDQFPVLLEWLSPPHDHAQHEIKSQININDFNQLLDRTLIVQLPAVFII